MTEEKWEQNKSCALSSRAHKWHWKLMPNGMPSDTTAVCAHCGVEEELNRHEQLPGHP